MSEKVTFPGRGQTWTSRSTNKTTEIYGRRMNLIGHVSQAEHGYVETPLSEFLTEFEYSSCNHAETCCQLHGTHADPHRGCILR